MQCVAVFSELPNHLGHLVHLDLKLGLLGVLPLHHLLVLVSLLLQPPSQRFVLVPLSCITITITITSCLS